MALLETAFPIPAFANALGYALPAPRARAAIGNERLVGVANKVGGSLPIGAGVATITAHAS